MSKGILKLNSPLVNIELMTSTLDDEKHDSYFNYLIHFSIFFICNFAFPIGPSTYKRLNNKSKKVKAFSSPYCFI